ncbi:MAG: glycosyltransferase family 29 protein [Candidatus Izemoplasmatales bacterium]|nr:glycosyltransferase family 29 protein [Candidatus Izemoplasmatales bacterium]
MIKKRERPSFLSYPHGRRSEAEYAELVRGKSVIIVGPAGYLRNENKGDWINSFELVVRVNHAIPIAFPEDYGNRTDVLYHIMSHRGKRAKEVVNMEEILAWKRHGIKWLVIRKSATSDRVLKLAPLLDGQFPWSCIHHRFEDSVCRAVRVKSPNTGIMAIAHLLNAGVKCLTVTGFDLYASGCYENYGDLKAGEDAKEVNARWHDLESQKEYLRSMIRRDKRIQIDPHLEGAIGR